VNAGHRFRDAFLSGRRLVEASSERNVYGSFLIELQSVSAVRSLALAGLDFVVVDMEHGLAGLAQLSLLCAEANACGISPLVRVPGLDAGYIGRVLEAGAGGVVVPHVMNVEDVRAAVRAVRFPPLGERSVAPLTPFLGSGLSRAEIESGLILLIQVEHVAALVSVAELTGVTGVDGVFVGPFDLAQSIGPDVRVDDPSVFSAAAVLSHAVRPGQVAGAYVHDPAASSTWSSLGFKMLCLGYDGLLLTNAARASLEEARGPK
jgi:2-keto-3-deoxy-L-rhamnonate aldolase RhmA